MAKVKKKKEKSKSAKKSNPGKVITGTCRSNYMFVNKLEYDRKDTAQANGKKCKTGIIIKKKDKKTIKRIKNAIKTIAVAKFGEDVKLRARNFLYPLRDADEEMEEGTIDYDKALKNCYFLTAKSYKLPGLVNEDNEPIEDPDDREELLVSGFYFKFSVTFKAFDNESKGVRVELNNMMFIKEGKRLDGGVSAEDEDWG